MLNNLESRHPGRPTGRLQSLILWQHCPSRSHHPSYHPFLLLVIANFHANTIFTFSIKLSKALPRYTFGITFMQINILVQVSIHIFIYNRKGCLALRLSIHPTIHLDMSSNYTSRSFNLVIIPPVPSPPSLLVPNQAADTSAASP